MEGMQVRVEIQQGATVNVFNGDDRRTRHLLMHLVALSEEILTATVDDPAAMVALRQRMEERTAKLKETLAAAPPIGEEVK